MMAVIELSIDQPQNNQAFVGSPNVDFQGTATLPDELESTSIYYRWYSSLYQAEEEQYSINIVATTSAESVYSHLLDIGSHIITFAASDVAGESLAEFETIQHSGVTGGSKEGDNQRLTHVFKANFLLPVNGASVSHNSVLLQAEAPSQWGVADDPNVPLPPYTVNSDYHAINRLQYRWLFEPIGAPASRPIREFIPEIETLEFSPQDETIPATIPTRIGFTAVLPAGATGQYRITLFVEDNQNEFSEMDSSQITVTLT